MRLARRFSRVICRRKKRPRLKLGPKYRRCRTIALGSLRSLHSNSRLAGASWNAINGISKQRQRRGIGLAPRRRLRKFQGPKSNALGNLPRFAAGAFFYLPPLKFSKDPIGERLPTGWSGVAGIGKTGLPRVRRKRTLHLFVWTKIEPCSVQKCSESRTARLQLREISYQSPYALVPGTIQ